jgi:hypothetical protein
MAQCRHSNHMSSQLRTPSTCMLTIVLSPCVCMYTVRNACTERPAEPPASRAVITVRPRARSRHTATHTRAVGAAVSAAFASNASHSKRWE